MELDAQDTELFRGHLERIREEAERAAAPEEWQSVQASFRGELRQHRDRSLERRALFLDEATGVWNRQKLDSRLRELLDEDDPFCVLVVCIRNLKRLDQRHSPAVIEAGIKALLQRFTAMGRWDEEAFAAILNVDPAAAISLSREATRRLSGAYPVQQNGVSRSITLQAVAGVIDRSSGADGPTFQQKLLQMSAALSSA